MLPGVTVTPPARRCQERRRRCRPKPATTAFPAVPPGTYSLTYELSGFNRSNATASKSRSGFTANVNVELALATLQETVTVSGASPVIDTTATRTVQNFKLEQLQSIPNARDMWALLAVTPSVQMSRIDVGGNRAGTQTGYTAYGFSGQVRVLIEGINTTEGTGGAGFYFDYSSLEEVFLGTSRPIGRDAEPGRAEPVHRQVGRQPVHRRRISRLVQQLAAGLEHSRLVHGADGVQQQPDPRAQQRDRSLLQHRSTSAARSSATRCGGLGPTASSSTPSPSRTSTSTRRSTPSCGTPVGKGTYQANQNHKLDRLLTSGARSCSRTACRSARYTYNSAGPTFKQDSGSWVWKGEWNGTLSDKLYVEARYGDFGYYFPTIANSEENYFFRDSGTLRIDGAHRKWQLDRDRKQIDRRGHVLPRHQRAAATRSSSAARC